MLRFVRGSDGVVAFDIAARWPGRGAWTCARAACVQRAADKGGFARAFEAPCVVDKGSFAATVADAIEHDVLSLLGLLRRASQIVVGRDDAARSRDRAVAVGLAADLAERSRRDVTEAFSGLPVVELPSMARVGGAIGTRDVGVVAILRGALSQRLLDACARRTAMRAPSAASVVASTGAPAPSDDEGVADAPSRTVDASSDGED